MDTLRARTLAHPSFKADPYPFYARLRADSPVCRVSAFLVEAWIVTRYDDALGVLKDQRLSKNITSRMRWLPRFTAPLTQQMLNRDPPDHTRLRALVSRAFTPSRVAEMRSRIQEMCDRLLDGAATLRSFDLVRDYALPLPLNVISEMLGIPPADRRRFQSLTAATIPLGAPASPRDVVLPLPSLWLLMRYLRKLLEARRAKPRDDLMSALVQTEEAGDRLSEDELLGMVLLLLFAGYETTVGLISSGALALLQNPAQKDRLLADPGLMEPAVEELLRFTSPVEITPPRLAMVDFEIRSVPIRRGELVAVVLGAANRDPAQFPDPDRLDISRSPNRHLAFGQATHFCLGASLARMECEIAIRTLFQRCPALALAQPVGELRWRKALPLRTLESLSVTTVGFTAGAGSQGR